MNHMLILIYVSYTKAIYCGAKVGTRRHNNLSSEAEIDTWRIDMVGFM